MVFFFIFHFTFTFQILELFELNFYLKMYYRFYHRQNKKNFNRRFHFHSEKWNKFQVFFSSFHRSQPEGGTIQLWPAEENVEGFPTPRDRTRNKGAWTPTRNHFPTIKKRCLDGCKTKWRWWHVRKREEGPGSGSPSAKIAGQKKK